MSPVISAPVTTELPDPKLAFIGQPSVSIQFALCLYITHPIIAVLSVSVALVSRYSQIQNQGNESTRFTV